MSSSSHIDSKKRDMLDLGKGPTKGLEHTLTPEKLYSIKFTKHDTKFCLSSHYNGANSYLFINGTGIIMFKVKDSEISAIALCLGNLLKDFSVDNIKQTGLNGYVYDFSVDYIAIAIADILDIHKYLMKMNGMFGFVKQIMFSACNISGVNSLKQVSVNNQECKVKSEIININTMNLCFILTISK